MSGDKSRCCKFLELIDVFSYIPVPTAYPVSTNKSKFGSILFICVLISYLIYDFYNFVTNNIPIINAYRTNIINSGPFPMPKISFGMYYKQNTINGTNHYMLNN